jgi:muramoyltetrapeptide carboxypeptidase LdcA involved in peptidoglycan recycling
MTIRPARLKAGDTVAVLSTSWGGPHAFPAIYEAGVAALQRLGLTVREYPGTRRSATELRADPQGRAADLNAAFEDPSIAGIISSIGGDDSARILPYLDPDVIRENPKVFMGYSDTATQLLFVHQLGLVTFNGPAVMAGFAQSSQFPAFEPHVRSILFDPTDTYDYEPYPYWVDRYAEWEETEDPTAVGELRPGADWRFLHGDGPVSGPLVGGCIEVLEFLKGSRYWPAEEWWTDRILFLETSEEVPSVAQVRYWLFNYGVQGVLDQLQGLIIGRPRGYTDDQKQELDEAVHAVVVEEFGASHVAIATNFDFGHTDPQWILPLGVVAELDPAAKTFRLLEPAVS